PDYPIILPDNTKCWYHEDGYVVNPKQMSVVNRELALQAGCEVIDDNASFQFQGNSYFIKINAGSVFETNELYLLAGAKNKEISETANLKMVGFESTFLTAISTVRYRV